MANWDIATAGSSLTFATSANSWLSPFSLDTNHFVVAGQIGSADKAIVFSVDTSTWAVSTSSTITFDGSSTYVSYSTMVQMDANHFVNFFATTSGGNRSIAQTIAVNTSTWAVTTAGSNFQFNSNICQNGSALKIDTTHAVLFYRDSSNGYGYAQSFTINTSTWGISTSAASFNFANFDTYYLSAKLIDANHFILFQRNASSYGIVQTLAVNTSNWTVSTTSSPLTFTGTNSVYYPVCYKVDTNHFISFWVESNSQGYAQVFAVNTSTWAVTTANATKFNYDAISAFDGEANFRVEQVDTNHFIFYWEATSTASKTEIFEVNTSTWAISTSAASLTFETQRGFFSATCKIDTSHYINFWASGTSGVNGKAQVFTVTIPATTSIKTIDGLAYASVKTVDGLAIASVKTFNGLA